MRSRCLNESDKGFRNYGARRIKICERWNSFENFLWDMGPRPSSQHTIDRIDNNGDYEPSNCRWATKAEQSQNRRICVLVEIDGVTKPLGTWAVEIGISPSAIGDRYHKRGLRGRPLIAPPKSPSEAARSRKSNARDDHGRFAKCSP